MSRASGVSARKVRDAAPLFAALGDETRLRLVARLSSGGPRSIARLAAHSPVSRQAIRSTSRCSLARALRSDARGASVSGRSPRSASPTPAATSTPSRGSGTERCTDSRRSSKRDFGCAKPFSETAAVEGTDPECRGVHALQAANVDGDHVAPVGALSAGEGSDPADGAEEMVVSSWRTGAVMGRAASRWNGSGATRSERAVFEQSRSCTASLCELRRDREPDLSA